MPDDHGRPDRAAADPEVHWAVGFAPADTDLFLHHEVVIEATGERVFACLTDATAWTDWYPGVTRCDAPPVLSQGQMFRLEFLHRGFDVSVGELQAPHRFGWAGVSTDLSVYHAWLLRSEPGRVLVVFEVSARGPAATGISAARLEMLTTSYRKLLLRLRERVGAAPVHQVSLNRDTSIRGASG